MLAVERLALAQHLDRLAHVRVALPLRVCCALLLDVLDLHTFEGRRALTVAADPVAHPGREMRKAILRPDEFDLAERLVVEGCSDFEHEERVDLRLLRSRAPLVGTV